MPVAIRRPPLSAMMLHPVEEIERLGLKVEGSQTADLDQMKPYESVLLTAHGPYTRRRPQTQPRRDRPGVPRALYRRHRSLHRHDRSLPGSHADQHTLRPRPQAGDRSDAGTRRRLRPAGRGLPAHRRLRRRPRQGDRAGELRRNLVGGPRRHALRPGRLVAAERLLRHRPAGVGARSARTSTGQTSASA